MGYGRCGDTAANSDAYVEDTGSLEEETLWALLWFYVDLKTNKPPPKPGC